jgi:predicted oxidoreductase
MLITMEAVLKKKYESDAVIIGAVLPVLLPRSKLLDHNKKGVDCRKGQADKLGGLAKESFGGVMLVDSHLQRRSRIKDSPELALSDWLSTAEFGGK